ncbi:hypothetical protein O0L34_g1426 [Tuta absoluta]|nr:hypothetical protein O0L34_g1426 [Tuta absoluta]
MICNQIVKYFVLLTFTTVSRTLGRSDLFTIDTEGCKIPAYPLVTQSIMDLLAAPSDAQINCSRRIIPLVLANATHIWVHEDAKQTVYQIFELSAFYCCYRNFSALGTFENIAYGPGRHEFVRVECFYYNDKIYEDVFKFNVYEELPQKVDNKAFSVLMFGIDNISRKNFLRTMPKTAQFLKLRGSVQLQGFNKLGDNSLPNIIPMLAGKSFRESEDICFHRNIYNAEACPFIWDQFKKANYQTALGSDSAIGVLDLNEALLPYKPTDFYMQSFNFETRHTFKDRTYDYHLCLRNRYMFRELLTFAKDVLDTVRRSKLFGLFWEESVTHHEHINYPYILDEDYSKLLKNMEKKKILDDAIVIFFSDHGTRFGPVLKTGEGRQESRLPLFDMMLPARFRRLYRRAYRNLQMNSLRLSTPYDVYETLKDIINITSLEDRSLKERARNISGNERAFSLFLPVPASRTCKSSDIPEHWCSCLSGEITTISGKGRSATAKYVMKHINQILSEFPKCHQLSIEKILEVTGMKNDDMNKRTYRVLLQAKPGGGVFEATLVQEHKMWVVSGSVGRLNAYKDQSYCVKDPLAKLYCHCRKSK